MTSSLAALAVSVGAITLAEMGDKTQLLAMAFATRFKFRKVLLGIFAATVLNHGLAVLVGSFLTRTPALGAVLQVAAALSFLLFGLWTLRGDKLEGEQDRSSRWGPTATVAVAFFLAEMGDKTQFATLALSAKYPDVPWLVLAGTTTGMLLADGFGIVFGVLMCRRIPERKVKFFSAVLFMVFGLWSVWGACRECFGLSAFASCGIVSAAALASGLAAWFLVTHEDKSRGYEGVSELNACADEEKKA